MKTFEIPVFFTDAGPPPSLMFEMMWAFVLILSFLIFAVARPAVSANTLSRINGKDISIGLVAPWWVQQVHLCIIAWMLFDFVYRGFSYAFLPLSVLWRRQMLPISDGIFGVWLNCIRFAVLCGMQGNKHNDPMCADSQLPFFGLVSNITMMMNISKSPMTAMERHRCQWVTIATVVTMLCIAVSFCSVLLRLFPSKCSVQSNNNNNNNNNNINNNNSNINNNNSNNDDNNNINNAMENMTDSEVEEDLWWDMGEPDDACLCSAEAIEEEAYWKETIKKDTVQQFDDEDKNNKEDYGMKVVFLRCWPVLCSICYAGLYAYNGGLPILMRWVYPICTVLASLCTIMA